MAHSIGVSPTLYEILGLDRDVSHSEIEAQYFYLGEIWDPKTNPGREAECELQIMELTKAYLTLSNPATRAKYDKKLDFDIVVLDRDLDKTPLAEVSEIYKRSCISRYDEIVKKFEVFKIEMNESLWLLKTTSFFFFVNVATSIVIVYSLSVFLQSTLIKPIIYESIKDWLPTLTFVIITLNFTLFRYLWQKKRLKK